MNRFRSAATLSALSGTTAYIVIFGAFLLFVPLLAQSSRVQDPSGGAPGGFPKDGLELQGSWPGQPGNSTPGGNGIVGSATCAACHADIAETHEAHPMARTARTLAEDLGSLFSPERLNRPAAWRSTAPEGAARPAYERSGEAVTLRSPGGESVSVAVLFGSGRRGVTPVAFHEAGTMRELRLSWSRGLDRWIETPGAEGDRDPLGDLDSPEETGECLSCHATAVAWRAGVPDPARSEWGVQCERCHGPGAEHAARLGEPAAIFDPGKLSPARQVAFCGQCHRKPTDFEPLEVFGRNRGLSRHAAGSLMMSACFRKSPAEETISCLSCHDPHRSEDSVAARSRKACLGCHEDPAAEHAYERVDDASDCVGCHLPRREEVFPGAGFTDHWIRVQGTPPSPGSADFREDLQYLEALYRNEIAGGPPPRRAARLHLGLGELLQAQGLRSSALEALERGLALDPDYGQILKAAALLRQEGEEERALSVLERALAVEPDAAQAYFDLGDLRLARGNAERAVTALERARTLRPASAAVLGTLGAAYRSTGRFDEALDAGLEAVQRDPERAFGWLELGRTRRIRRETAEAGEALRAALALDPSWPPALDALARLLALDPDETVRDAAEAVRLADRLAGLAGYREPRSLDLLAAAHAAGGNFELAIRTAERAIERSRSLGLNDLGLTIEERLQLYRDQRPYLEPAAR